MEFDYNKPIFQQVAQDIRRGIAVGALSPGEKLPTVAALSARYGINPNTVQRVIRELDATGVVFTKRGVGTFVSEDPSIRATMRRGLTEELMKTFLDGMKALGYGAQEAAQLLEMEWAHADI